MKKPILDEDAEEVRRFYCPLCDRYYPTSEYLETVFSDRRAEYVANMVTHYRHHHINYYNDSVEYVSRFHDYDTFKEMVNNRAKRQIIRKTKDYLRENGITSDVFAELQSTDEKTMELAERVLGRCG